MLVVAPHPSRPTLKSDCGLKADKHNVAIPLISACIALGWHMLARIPGALVQLGLKREDVVITSTQGTGVDPLGHHLSHESDSRYSVLDK
jgi:sirohydrochlorin ferrochelatase